MVVAAVILPIGADRLGNYRWRWQMYNTTTGTCKKLSHTNFTDVQPATDMSAQAYILSLHSVGARNAWHWQLGMICYQDDICLVQLYGKDKSNNSLMNHLKTSNKYTKVRYFLLFVKPSNAGLEATTTWTKVRGFVFY